ncbi:MAG: hypothetical protein KDG89_13485 [Geminicoccaceae bacterium]|nr:hypothetical protein [Geminicoccaceae bacterium]
MPKGGGWPETGTCVRLLAVLLAFAGGTAAAEPYGDAEWRDALRAGTAAAFERYLERRPLGRFASEAFRCLVEGRQSGGDAKACAAWKGPGPRPPTTRTEGVAVEVY